MKLSFSNSLVRAILLAAVLVSPGAYADILEANEVVPVLGGEAYTKVARVQGEPGALAYRYVRDHETFDKWTTSVTYTLYRKPELGDRPKSVAAVIVASLEGSNPQAQYNLTGNEEGTAVVLDFLTWPESKEFMEYDVYRLESRNQGEGVASLQISVQFPFVENPSEADLKEIASLRNVLVKQAVQYDMRRVKEMLNNQYDAIQ